MQFTKMISLSPGKTPLGMTMHGTTIDLTEELTVRAILSSLQAKLGISLSKDLENITEITTCLLQADRGSFWLFSDDHGTLACQDRYDNVIRTHTHNEVICQKDFPDYFSALLNSRTITFDMAQCAVYDPAQFGSRMSPPQVLFCVPVFDDQYKVIGVIRFECDAPAYRWGPTSRFICSKASRLVSAALSVAKRVDLEAELKRTNEQLLRKNTLLKEANDVMSALKDNTQFGIAMIQNNVFIQVNKALEQICGVPENELRGERVDAFIHTEDKKALMQQHQEHPKELVELNCRIIRPDGEERLARIVTRSVEFKRKPALLVTIDDITEREQERIKYLASDFQYQEIINKTGTALIIINKDTTMSFANELFAEISGYSQEELTNGRMRWTDFVHEDDIPRMKKFHDLRREDPGSAPPSYVFRLKTKDGSYKTVANTVTLLPGTQNSSASMIDITEEVEAKEQYKALVENSIDVIMSVRPDLTIDYCNPVIKDYTGVSAKRLIGKRPNELRFPKDLTEKWTTELTKVFRTGKAVDFEMQLANGIWVFARMIPVMGNDGNVSKVMIIAADITNKKRREEDELRSGKLDALSVLAGGIGHDFNNLLTAILGNVSLAQMDIQEFIQGLRTLFERSGMQELFDQEQLEEQLEAILKTLTTAKEACVRGGDLTRQLTLFAKEGSLSTETASMVELLRRSAKFFIEGTSSDIEFIDLIDNETWAVDINKGDIERVFNNLVLNATQAMPHGGNITIVTENVMVSGAGMSEYASLEKGPYVKVSVIDQGVGISKENLKNLFVPYFTTKEKGQGHGLAGCYAIIRKHKGTITVSSEENKGTTFSILLPASPGKEIIPKEQPNISSLRNIFTGRVLVMEDDKAVSPIAIKMLSFLGFTPVLTEDGDQAVQAYIDALNAHEPYAAVFFDLNVPGGKGGRYALDIIKMYKKDIMSVLASGDMKDEGGNFTDFLHKPYTIEDIAQVFKKHLPFKEEDPGNDAVDLEA